jgi:hypothetical protein
MSMRDDEVITEAVLCMAGKKYSSIFAPSEPGEACPKDSVALNPTVWIYCGSKKCKKKVLKAIQHISALNQFLVRFQMETPHASLYAPWPAAEEHPPQFPRLIGEVDNVSFAIQDRISGLDTICGARARFTIETSTGIVERYSTIGGLVIVNDSLYAITTAHTIVSCWLECSHSTSVDETESTSNVSSDEDSDCETSSESGYDASTNNPCSLAEQMVFTKEPSTKSNDVYDSGGIWTVAGLPKVLAYMKRGTTNGDYSFPITTPSTSDFALVDVGSRVKLSNKYRDPKRNTIETISDHVPTSEILPGDVWIITSCGDVPVRGYMLEGDASIILRGTVMRTKKIEVTFASGKLPYTIH